MYTLWRRAFGYVLDKSHLSYGLEDLKLLKSELSKLCG